MTTIELYRRHKAGEVGRDRFLYEVRRDKNLPWVTNVTSYDDAVKILKNKGIISEAEISENYEVHFSDGVRQAKKFKDVNSAMSFAKQLVATNKNLQHVDVFKAGSGFNSTADTDAVIAWWGDGSFMDNKSKKDPALAAKKMSISELNEADANVPTDPAVDRVNPYFLKKGVEKMLAKEKELTNDSYINALNKAAKQLENNPHAFDEEMFANAKDVEKADAKLETEEVKKANHKNKANEMKKVKLKALKEAAIGELKAYLKKKEQINEDSHYKHNVGSEVHTSDGKGKVVEIVGGTLTVEMEDGTQRDYQINTVDHFTQKASEELPVQEPKADQSVADMWANWKGNTFGGIIGDPEHFKKPLDLSKLKEYIAKNKDDKEKMGKIKEALKKLKEAKGVIVPTGATDTQVTQIVKKAFPNAIPGQQIDIIRK